MILVLDSSALAFLVNPTATPPYDPETSEPLAQARERVDGFLHGLNATDTLIIPTPVLAEALVRAEEGGPGLLAELSNMARVRVRPFGERAAVETAQMTREALAVRDKRVGSTAAWQKVKIDRQIVAIARVEGADAIYSDDHDLVGFAKRVGMKAFSTWDLNVPEPEVNLFTTAGLPATGAVEDDSSLGRFTPEGTATPPESDG